MVESIQTPFPEVSTVHFADEVSARPGRHLILVLRNCATPGRLLLAVVGVSSGWFLLSGQLASAVAVLLLPVIARGALEVLDVFWISFSGQPLLRASRRKTCRRQAERDLAALSNGAVAGDFGRLSGLPMPIGQDRGPRVSPFAPLPKRRLPRRRRVGERR